MKLNVHVLGQHVGVLEQVGDFRSVMAYLPDVAPESLVSLTMPVRTESYPWDDELHPIFRMNLPEGYLLQVLQEEFGPIIGASPIALLNVIGSIPGNSAPDTECGPSLGFNNLAGVWLS
jgi:serine/threonine-protein kinase HipA